MNTPETTISTIDARIAHRLATQQGGTGKIMRRVILRAARCGHIILPSGAWRQITVHASI